MCHKMNHPVLLDRIGTVYGSTCPSPPTVSALLGYRARYRLAKRATKGLCSWAATENETDHRHRAKNSPRFTGKMTLHGLTAGFLTGTEGGKIGAVKLLLLSPNLTDQRSTVRPPRVAWITISTVKQTELTNGVNAISLMSRKLQVAGFV